MLVEQESRRSDFCMGRRVRMLTLRDHQHRRAICGGQLWGELVELAHDPA